VPEDTGVGDEEMLHAYRNPIRIFEMDDMVMLIGGDETGRLVDVGVGPRVSSSSFTLCLRDPDS